MSNRDSSTTVPPRLARTRAIALVAVYGLLSLWAVVMCSVGPFMALFGSLPDPSYRFTATSAGAFKVLTLGAAVLWAIVGAVALANHGHLTRQPPLRRRVA